MKCTVCSNTIALFFTSSKKTKIFIRVNYISNLFFSKVNKNISVSHSFTCCHESSLYGGMSELVESYITDDIDVLWCVYISMNILGDI